MIKSRRLRWAGHVTRIEEGGNAFKILTGKPTEKIPLSLYTALLEKYPTLFVFCKNLVDFNEASLHEVTLNLHTHV